MKPSRVPVAPKFFENECSVITLRGSSVIVPAEPLHERRVDGVGDDDQVGTVVRDQLAQLRAAGPAAAPCCRGCPG